MADILFDNTFQVKDIDSEGKKFDKISRLHCRSDCSEMDLILDINSSIYPMEINETFQLMLATKQSSLLGIFEYIMLGKVYCIKEEKKSNVEESKTDEDMVIDESENSRRLSVHISYGGLLMRLQGDAKNLVTFKSVQDVCLLMKKTA